MDRDSYVRQHLFLAFALVLATAVVGPAPNSQAATISKTTQAATSPADATHLVRRLPIAPRSIEQSRPSPIAHAPWLTSTVHLPLVQKAAGDFNPATSTTLAGGSQVYSSFNIPLGVTVTVLSHTIIFVSGAINISGTLMADCSRIELRAQGAVSILGTVDNRCSTATDDPGDLVISAQNGNLSIGTPTAGAPLQTSGNLDITNDPTLRESDFAVLPHERSSIKLAPVCSATSDTLEDSVVPGFPIDVAFTGNGVDPDGGPVMYAWSFGDNITATSMQQNPTHSYAAVGSFDVTLTVTDDEAQTCTAQLRVVMDDGDSNVPSAPAVYIEPDVLVVQMAAPASFSSAALDPQGQPLTYSWAFGSIGLSASEQPTFTFATAGRHVVTLTVTNSDNVTSTATAAIYVYTATTTAAAFVPLPRAPQQAANCIGGGPNVFNPIYNPPAAGAGRNGRRAVFRGSGNVVLGAGTSLKAQDGGNGVNRNGAGDIMGGNGGNGGSLHVLVAGRLTVCGGASFSNGNGGNGGNALSNTPASGMAWAKGGNGGKAGAILEIKATVSLDFVSPFGFPITINPGSGGAGGNADALGGNGANQCPRGQDGASAKANGGNGGNAGKQAFVTGAVGGLANIEIQGGKGGAGGYGFADGGNGGDATCVTTATGGDGRNAEARGGNGGHAKLTGAGGFALAADAFTAGDGGKADALGGIGGNATATPPGGTTANGGKAGKAIARGGKGGAGRINAKGGNANATGFNGGHATATGAPGLSCGDGGSATATGGLAGAAEAVFGAAGGAGPALATANATAGAGGNANATGGKGGDCLTCPGGKGGNGGPATATGRNGANALGNGVRNGGAGGDANATGGNGGEGADCCQKFNDKPGGNGGDGGNAASTAGTAGNPAGAAGGANGIKGGDGGNGGDGLGPGAGGGKGLGTGVPVDIPDGVNGMPGLLCPVPVTWYIYHSTIPDGPIVPGSVLTLTTTATRTETPTATPTSTPQPTGQVQAQFVSAAEFGGPVQYAKSGAIVFVQSGAIHYQLGSLPPSFPVAVVQVELDHQAGPVGAVQLVGYVGGTEVAQVSTQNTAASHEILRLPPIATVSTAPKYDSFRLVGNTAFSFDHWWVVIIDP